MEPAGSVIPLGVKPCGYFEKPRADLVEFLPRPLGRVLDVGCGKGAVGRELRKAGALELIGLEIEPGAAKLASEVFDSTLQLDAHDAREALAASARFDTILCYDVLEHLYDPGRVLGDLRHLAKPGATLHISVPNVKHFSLFADLFLRDTFGYAPEGHRDATHIRWFTRRDMERLVEESGWEVLGTTTHPFKPGRRLLSRLGGHRVQDLFAVQWYVLCRAR